jgi:small multidrug resistance pump
MISYFYLAVAIIFEVIATTLMKQAQATHKPAILLLCFFGYLISFALLYLTLGTIPTGIAYAIWSGLGIVLIAGLAFFIHGQQLDSAGLIGLGLIIAGVLVVSLSKTAVH